MKKVSSLYSIHSPGQRKRWPVTPDRRTIVVLTTLLGAMTLGSLALLGLEPGPMQPLGAISLEAITPRGVGASSDSASESLLPPGAPEAPWLGIVIHDSGSLQGSAREMDRIHRQYGLSSLGYHFVIHNGQGGPDGERFASSRWTHQQAGAYCRGPGADRFNQHAIGICLIGDFNRQQPTDRQLETLLKLVRQLQLRFHIPADRVWVQTGGQTNASPGKFFPTARFQRQLRTF